jgi:pimeloyl-ACP methyl ester carboxylesterase
MKFRHRPRTLALLGLLLFALSGCKVLGMRTLPMDELKEKYESSASRWMMVDGTDVHYRIEGNMEGPTLILLHGMLASLHTWEGWMPYLKPYYRIIRIDIPGFGLTGPMANKDYTPEYAVRLVEMMREKLNEKYGNVEKATFVGNSLGGFISWYYAAQHPDRVEKLVLIDPIAYKQPVPFIIRFGARPVFGWYAKFQTPRFIIKRNVRIVYGDPDKATDETIDRYFELLCREGNRESMVEYFRTLIKYNGDERIEAAVRQVKAPTLLMFGEKDRWVPPSLVERWQQDVENLQVAIIDGAGHVPMEELPDETVRVAYRFLTDGKELPDNVDTSDSQSSAGGEAAPPSLDDIDEGASYKAPEPDNDNATESAPADEADEPAPANDNSYEEPAATPEPAPPPAKKRPGMADW